MDGAAIYGASALRGRAHTPGTGYTERAEASQGSGGDIAGVAVEDESVASPATLGLDGSFSGTADWAVVGVEILPGDGGLALSPTGGKALMALASTTYLKRVRNTLTKEPARVAALASPPAGTVWRSNRGSGSVRARQLR